MDYQETLTYLFSQLPMYQRIGNAAYNKSLTNILALCEALGHPERQFRNIHVAGTNGKGSSSHMLAAVLQQAGYKTGLYTSPHLKSFTERIRIDGAEIGEEFVVEFVAQCQPLFAKLKPSFFEMTVALAFAYFAREQVEVAVIEVGLGGRLDSTNIVTPLVSLITNIGYDHMLLLGDTLPQIAAEKAGIIKDKVPVVVGQYQEEVAGVFEEAAALHGAPLFYADRQLQVSHRQETAIGQTLTISKSGSVWLPDLEIDLGGLYQQHNVLGVLQTLLLLQEMGFAIPEQAIRQGLRHTCALTGLKGRWQILQHNPLTIADTAHNKDGLQQVVKQLAQLPVKKVHFVFGTVNDKDIGSILRLLPPAYVYYFCQASIPRALPVDELVREAGAVGLAGKAFPTVAEAVAAALQEARPDEAVFIGGSNFVVAEVEGL